MDKMVSVGIKVLESQDMLQLENNQFTMVAVTGNFTVVDFFTFHLS